LSELLVSPAQKAVRRYEKARLDFYSTRTQMFFGAILIFLSCAINYWSTLKASFLLDDYWHIKYLGALFAGHVEPFLQNFTSLFNSSGLAIGYGPLVSLSVLLDYLIYHIHSAGYHFTNILLYAATAILTAVLTLQIASRLSERTAAVAALWSGLLFSVYPLHGEPVAWLSGRAVLMACALYLTALSLFLRHQEHGSKNFLKSSLLLYALALLCHPIALSLPLAIAALSLLPHRSSVLNSGPKYDFKALLLYLAVMFVFLLIDRDFASSNDVGNCWRILHDNNTWSRIFLPATTAKQSLLALVPLIAAAVIYAIRIIFIGSKRISDLKTILVPVVLLLWFGTSLITSAATLHITQTLTGSYLFFISSVPLIILVALLAVPHERGIKQKQLQIFSGLAVLILVPLFGLWASYTQANVANYKAAAWRVFTFKQLLIAAMAKSNNGVTLLGLPESFMGAGMVGKRDYLDTMLSPPLIGRDLRNQVNCIETSDTGLEPEQLASAIKSGRPLYYFDIEHSQLVPVQLDQRSFNRLNNFANLTPQSLNGQLYQDAKPYAGQIVDGRDWHVQEQRQTSINCLPDSIKVNVDKVALTWQSPIILPATTRTTTIALNLENGSAAPDIVLLRDKQIVARIETIVDGNLIKARLLPPRQELVGTVIGLYFAPYNQYQIKSLELKQTEVVPNQ